MLKRITAAALAFLLSVLLIGCGSDGRSGAGNGTWVSDDGVITIITDKKTPDTAQCTVKDGDAKLEYTVILKRAFFKAVADPENENDIAFAGKYHINRSAKNFTVEILQVSDGVPLETKTYELHLK